MGVWGRIAKHVFLPILYQMKNAQEVLKRNLRPKRLGGSAMEGKCQDCASNVRPNLLASVAVETRTKSFHECQQNLQPLPIFLSHTLYRVGKEPGNHKPYIRSNPTSS